MKRTIIYFISVASLLLTFSCQPSPEKAIVVNKNEGLLEESLINENKDKSEYLVPRNYSCSIDAGKNTIKINAAITIPDIDSFPVKRIAPDGFSQDEANKIINFFAADSKIVSSEIVQTKSEIEALIVEYKANLKNQNNTEDDISGIKAAIKQLEKEYENAPVSLDRKEITPRFKYDDGVEYIDILSDLGYKDLSQIYIANSDNNNISMCNVFIDKSRVFLGSIYLEGKLPEQQTISPEQATQLALETISELGYTGLVVAKVQTGITEDQKKQGYIVTIKNEINGLPATTGIIISGGQQDYAAKWRGDEIKICIDDGGISSFDWFKKSKLIDIPNTNIRLLPFEEMIEISKQQLKNQFSWIESNYKEHGIEVSTDILIDRINLEYDCIPEKDKPGQFLLLPVWNFYGDLVLNLPDEGIESVYQSSLGHILLSINAVDGSIIS